MLEHTRHVAQSVAADRFLFYSNYIDENDDWSGVYFQKRLQQGDGLGDKMKNAFERIFKTHKKVVIIGSDCATLTAKIIADAFEKLAIFPFVIGPATDGGYYLLGMNRFSPAVFDNIEWSTSSVLSKTLEIIKHLGKPYYLLPELPDIDRKEDWKKFGWEI